MMHRIRSLLVLLVIGFLTSCAGSTQFEEGDYTITIAKGSSDTVDMTLVTDGSHSGGTFDFTATVQFGEGVTATVAPTSATADPNATVTVTITVDASTTSSSATVYVEGFDDENQNGAGRSISVTIVE